MALGCACLDFSGNVFNLRDFDPRIVYRDEINSDVKGSVCVIFEKLHHRGERGRKGRECKFYK